MKTLKRILAITLFLSFMLSSLAYANSANDTASTRYGDVNNDEAINAEDALLVLKHVVKLFTLDEVQQVSANVNGDDSINAEDALFILKYVVKLIDKFPVEETDETPEPTGTVAPIESPVPTETASPEHTETIAPTETVGPTETITPTEVPHVHEYVETSRTEASCVEVGKIIEECACGEKKETELSMACNKLITKTYKEPTCTEEGYAVYACSGCGETTAEETLEALGHDNIEVDRIEPTETENGYCFVECVRCLLPDEYILIIESAEHIHECTEVKRQEATCYKEGSITYNCRTCNEFAVTIEALGCDFVEISRTEPTESAEGMLVEKCSRCRAVKETELLRTSEEHNHSFSITGQGEVTCHLEGYLHEHCACGIDRKTTIPPIEHILVDRILTEPTCTKRGRTEKVCTMCETRYAITTLPKLAHTYVETSRTDALLTETCSVCGDVKETEITQ